MSLSKEVEEGIWERARTDATKALSEFYQGGAQTEIPENKPYPAGTPEAWEYASAWEHYIMSGLGY
jgi:hypothetical protein